MQSVVKEGYWESHWEETVFAIADTGHPLRGWIESNLGPGQGKTCIEVGCYPGKFMAVLGEIGFGLNGIDSYKDTSAALPAWLRTRGYKVGNFYEQDFTEFAPQSKFDLVCSFGLVEHFKNYDSIIGKHVSMVKPGAQILIEVPNLDSPLYRFLYKLLESEILESHVPEAMRIDNIVHSLEQHGCRIKKSEYVGHFYFRFVTKSTVFHKALASLINVFRPLFHLLPKSVYARYIGVIAEPLS